MRLKPLITIAAALFSASVASAQGTAAVTPDSLVAAVKKLAGSDHPGTFVSICVAPDNLTPRAAPPISGPRTIPDRATWYAKPYKVFDNLYFFGQSEYSVWAIITSQGIIASLRASSKKQAKHLPAFRLKHFHYGITTNDPLFQLISSTSSARLSLLCCLPG